MPSLEGKSVNDCTSLLSVPSDLSFLFLGRIDAPKRPGHPLPDMVLPPCEQRHRFLRYEGLDYPDTNIVDFEGRLSRIHMREVHRVTIFNFRGLLDLMAEGLTARMMMEHRDKSVLVCSPVGLGGGLSVRLSKEAYELEAVHLSPGITYGGGDADGWVWCLLGREFQTDP
ncbi:hypothetical protein Tco_0842436 [Tanacetum coccineum]|uniref:Uncharacterized protein n=1 Tax=Tanacetum coccineum TaxID=301880 RepID=A0ABQ5B4X1_9ASTR